nr:copia-type polyprotein [Tanacetum cinerariifolium]
MADEKIIVPVFDGIREPAVGIAQSEAEKKKLEELRMKDLQVKHYLYQAIDRLTFEQIMDRSTSKAVWNSMKQRFPGNAKVKRSMLQKLRRDFEVLEMKNIETISDYFGRVLTISNQIRSNGEKMDDVKIVEKILRTLIDKYLYVVVSIEESKNVDEMSIEELQSTLIVHEQKFKKVDKEDDQALRVEAGYSPTNRGRGRGRFNGRGRGRGRGRLSFNKETIECFNCHKLGHYSYECSEAKEANYAGFDEDEEVMLVAEVSLEETAFMADSGEENKVILWFLDSGCSNHMCGNKARFCNLDSSFSSSVKLGNNTRMMVVGRGSVKLFLNGSTYIINDVYYVPDLKNNLLSIGQLQQKGISFLFQSDVCKVFHPDKGLIFQSQMSTNRMFPISEGKDVVKEHKIDGRMYTSNDDNARLWHERMGHLSDSGLETLQTKGMVRDLPSFPINKIVCEDCMIGKQTKNVIPKMSNWRAEEVLELIHSDICGPITPASHTENRYFLSFIDDYSHKGWVYLITEKSQALESFKQFKRKVEVETGKIIKTLRTDRGGEYLSHDFTNFCVEQGIKRQLTTSFSPHQNGVAERKNRTVINMVVSMMVAKNMPKKFWGEATVWSFYVLNRCPTKALTKLTPQEVWSGIKPTVQHFCVWGCLAHVHIPKQKRTQLDNKSQVCILTGVSEESKAYRLIDPHTLKVVVSKDVIFEEHKCWDWGQTSSAEDEKEIIWGDYGFTNDDYEFVQNPQDDYEPADQHDQEENIDNQTPVIADTGAQSPAIGEGRPQRLRRPPTYLQDYSAGDDLEVNSDEENELNITDLIQQNLQDPQRYEDAIKDECWKKAMDLEIQAIEKNQTWKLVDLPKDTKCIRVKWVFKTKLNERGEIEKHKARLVARGYGQEYGIDYVEVYAPVARMDTIRLLIALAAQRGWNIYQLDVKSAFLHGVLEEEVYVQQPQGYVVKNSEHKVYKLHKALYGLKQAPRAWFSRIETYFIKAGFTRSNSEHTLFIKRTLDGKMLFVNIYVDDLLFTGNDEQLLNEFKESMKCEFEMSDLGKMRYFMGIDVLQTAAGIHVSQYKYAIEILSRFKMSDCNAVMNPIVPGCKLKSEEGELVDETLFKSLVGSLMYITTTRPDIQFIVSYISRFMSKPTDSHLVAAKRVLRYLQGTLDYGIWYRRGGKGEMEVFTDSDFAGDWNDRKSTSGYLVLWDGAAITWSSKKQSVVALSSTEAEYVAAAACACQVVWLRGILEELGLQQTEGTVIKCDNTSTIKLSRNPVFHGRCKHIGIKYHFLRDLVGRGTVELKHVGTKEQVADIFTKPLHQDMFIKLRKELGVCSLEDKQDMNA